MQPKTPKAGSKKTIDKLIETVLKLHAQQADDRQKHYAQCIAASHANLKLALSANRRDLEKALSANKRDLEKALSANKRDLETEVAKLKKRADEDAAASSLAYDKALEKLHLILEYGSEADVELES